MSQVCVGCGTCYQGVELCEYFKTEHVKFYKLRNRNYICAKCIDRILKQRAELTKNKGEKND
jgi:hypothetical protein